MYAWEKSVLMRVERGVCVCVCAYVCMYVCMCAKIISNFIMVILGNLSPRTFLCALWNDELDGKGEGKRKIEELCGIKINIFVEKIENKQTIIAF